MRETGVLGTILLYRGKGRNRTAKVPGREGGSHERTSGLSRAETGPLSKFDEKWEVPHSDPVAAQKVGIEYVRLSEFSSTALF